MSLLQPMHRRDPSQQNDEGFRGLLEALPDAIVIVNAEGRIVLVNSQTERLFGYKREDILNQPVEILVPTAFRSTHHLHREGYFAGPRVRGMGEGLTLHGQRQDGSEFPVEISLSPLETDNGRVVTAAIRDVTERRRVERTLAEKNAELEAANRTKDRFLATMSHELRTPLNAIIGFTGTLLMRLPGPLTEEQDSQLCTVRTSAHHLLALINDLLDLAKVESGTVQLHPEPVICQMVIEEVSAALGPSARHKGLTFTVECPLEPLLVRTDRRALNQILLNLTANAIKFTAVGTVHLQAQPGLVKGRPGVVISISDTGVGIRETDRARLFKAFQQLDTAARQRHQGSGLGLHLSHELAALLGAEITVRSTFEVGSTFAVGLADLP